MATIQQTTRAVFLLYCLQFIGSNPSSFFSVDALSLMKTSSPAAHKLPSRRDWLSQAGVGGMTAFVASVASTTTATVGFPQASFAAGATDEYLAELNISLDKMKPIPKMLEELKWDEARTVLKNPPVSKLWNLGDGQNTVLKLIKETGNVELFEVKDDLAYNLQTCDALVYANNFIEFQPGNGKLKLKEPIEAMNKALSLLEMIIKDSQ
mmetsp:Transcript_62941/g.73601  ORF Transcript_62941/g.73601 Transcript_62941/m.73601 type:complete len:209 (+) Transcript_62941:27-653(+)